MLVQPTSELLLATANERCELLDGNQSRQSPARAMQEGPQGGSYHGYVPAMVTKSSGKPGFGFVEQILQGLRRSSGGGYDVPHGS
jgi:hypothetical protein